MRRLGWRSSAWALAPCLVLAMTAPALARQGGGPYRGSYIPQYAFPINAAVSMAPLERPAVLQVDARQASRGILYITETMPARPGTLTVVYPKWVPGEHGPTGPIDELAGLRFEAAAHPLAFARDAVDMYAFHVTVPEGVNSITARFDLILNDASGVMGTPAITILNWNRAVLYQQGVDSHTWFVEPSITLPPDWDCATALRESDGKQNGQVRFDTVSLAMLVDSPLDMGRYAQHWELGRIGDAPVELDAFAATPQDLEIPRDVLRAYQRLPAEIFALYGSHHFQAYHALLTLSDAIGFQGIEHHQSSDNRAPDDFLTNPQESLAEGDLITHEFSHSWNGKYRRPADLATPNFQVPMRTDLLWVYEGLNQYMGDLLSFRIGLRDPKQYPEYLALIYAQMATEPGRQTTPVVALTTAAPFLYQASNSYGTISRSAGDFYVEGELVWLEADTLIRSLSHGAKSLDDFLHLYTQPAVTEPITKTYTLADIEGLLNQVQPYDWHSFFQSRIYEIAPQPPADALARAGWKLVYTDKPNTFLSAEAALAHGDLVRWFDLGFTATAAGEVKRLREGSPAWNAGMAQGDHIAAVDQQAFSSDALDYAMQQAQRGGTPITLTVNSGGILHTLQVAYQGAPQYPHLERLPGTADLLAQIMAPHAGQ